jgi:hypothetical protein
MKNAFVVLASLLALSACNQQHEIASPPLLAFEARETGVAYEVDLQVTPDSTAQARVWNPSVYPPVAGAVFVAGVDGGYIDPVNGIYDRLASALAHDGVASVFVKYRRPGRVDPSLADALAAADYLRQRGARTMAITGFSFGGAVVTHAAVLIPEVVTVLGFALQSRWTEPAAEFTRQSILIFHSRTDENVPFYAAGQILDAVPAHLRKELVAFDSGNHKLEGMAAEVDPRALAWLRQELGLAPRPAALHGLEIAEREAAEALY